MVVDFRQVKQQVSIAQVLAHYKVDVRRTNGASLRCRCPLPSHEGSKSDTFSANIDKNVFQCFSCGAKGNVLDLVQKMEGGTIKSAAETLASWFDVDGRTPVSPVVARAAVPQVDAEPARNIPLKEKWSKPGHPSDGRLKGLAYHPYLEGRGFSKELCEQFGIGHASKGKMAGRIVFPICNPGGDVVAYCGRAADEGVEPRWLQPEGFHKSLELYGIEKAEGRTVIIVESFWGVLACARADLPMPAVALMGRTLSEAQATLLGRFDAYVLLLDGDEPGRTAAVDIGSRLLQERKSLRVVFGPEGFQPDTLSPDDLHIIAGTL